MSQKSKDKTILIETISRMIKVSLDNRAKEGLFVDFIHQTNLDSLANKASVIDAFFAFSKQEQAREAKALIQDENLNPEAAERYIATSLKRHQASDNGTELNEILPKMSLLNPQYLTKKRSIFEKISAFLDKFKAG